MPLHRSRRHAARLLLLAIGAPLAAPLAAQSVAQSPVAAPLASSPTADPLATLLTRRATTAAEKQREPLLGDSVAALAVPPTLADALQRALPTFRWRGTRLASMDTRHAPGHYAASPDVVVSDLDGDGRLEAVLVGWQLSSERAGRDSVPTGGAPVIHRDGRITAPYHVTRVTYVTELVVGVRQSPTGAGADAFVVTVLKRQPGTVQPRSNAPNDVPAEFDGNALTGMAIGPIGREVSARGTSLPARARLAVRYQRADCKDAGWVFTVQRGAWRTRASRCTYGE